MLVHGFDSRTRCQFLEGKLTFRHTVARLLPFKIEWVHKEIVPVLRIGHRTALFEPEKRRLMTLSTDPSCLSTTAASNFHCRLFRQRSKHPRAPEFHTAHSTLAGARS